MGRGNAHGDATALASRSSLRCLIKEERDLLALHEALSRRPDQYLHAGAVESTLPLDELAAQCARSFLASENGPFHPEEKELVGQALYALALIKGEPHVELIAALDAATAKARHDYSPDEEEVEDHIRDLLLDEGLDEYELEEAMFDRDGEHYIEARERAIDDLRDLEVAPLIELTQYVFDLYHGLPVSPNVLRDRLPSPAEARVLRQEADRARAELPLAA
jgi:hypothetical protein